MGEVQHSGEQKEVEEVGSAEMYTAGTEGMLTARWWKRMHNVRGG